jgi:hypothetical protein
MCVEDRFKGGLESNRKRVHRERTNAGKIFSSRKKNGKLFQGLYNRAHRNKLVKAAARNTPLHSDLFFQTIEDESIKTVELEPRLINVIKPEDSRAPIMTYLRHYYEPDNNTKLGKGSKHTK